MLTGLKCVRKGPSDHGNDVKGFIKCGGYLTLQGNRQLTKNSALRTLFGATLFRVVH